MAIRHIEQGSFIAGIVSPRYWGRKDLGAYQAGVDECLNMYPTVEGNLQRRLPTVVTSLRDNTITDGRCIPWNFDDDRSAVVTISKNYVNVYATQSLTGKRVITKNPDFTKGLDSWVTSGTVKTSTSFPGTVELSMFNGDNTPTVSQVSTGLTDTINTLEVDAVAFVSSLGSGVVTLEITVGQGTTVGSNVLYTYTDADWKKDSRLNITARVTFTGVPTGGALWVRVRTSSPGASNLTNIDKLSLSYSTTAAVPPAFTSPYAEEDIRAIQYVQSPFTDQLVLVHKKYEPRELVLEGSTWSFRIINFTGTDPTWGDSYPSVCCAYQGRLMLAASEGRGQTIWGSNPGNWYDFDKTGAEADGLDLTMTDHGEIQWMSGHKQLVVGTTQGIYYVGPDGPGVEGGGSLFREGNIGVFRQSGHGNRKVQATVANDMTIHTSYEGDRIRGISNSNENQGWVSSDLTMVARNVVVGVKRLCWANYPQPMIYAITDTGKLLTGVFDPHAGIIGWSRHDTAGEFRDICMVHENGYESVYVIVRRKNGTMLEQFAGPDYFDKAFGGWQVHMDCGIERSFTTPVTVVTGLEHLEGEEVLVYSQIGNVGRQQGPYTVEGGQITVDLASTIHKVGIPFTSAVRTMPLGRYTAANGHSAVKSWSKVGVRMLYSSTPVLSVASTGGTFLPVYLPAQYDNEEDPPVPRNRTYEQQVLGAHDTEGQITVSTSNIWGLTITAIYGKAELSDV